MPPPHPADLRAIARLAAPAIAGQLLQTGVLYADRVMLGHYSAGALAGMQLAGPIEWTLVSVASAFSVGTLSIVGRATGAGDHETARRHTSLAILVALAVGWIVALAGYVGVLPALPYMFPNASTAPGGAIDLCRAYLAPALVAAPFFCVGVAGFAALAATGDTVTPLLIGTAVNLVHVGINFALIGGRLGAPTLGARGAGISTAASYALEAALTIAVLMRRDRIATLRPLAWPLRGDVGARALRRLARVASPAVAERALYHFGYMLFVWMIARLGDDAMAANQALIAIEAISFMTLEGFSTACASLVAQELGAGRPSNASRIGWLAAGLAAVTLSTFALAFVLLRRWLPALITPRADLQELAAAVLLVVATAQPFMAVGNVLGQGLRGAGATRTALLVSLFAGLGVRLATTWVATSWLGLGLAGIWVGSTADWAARTLLFVPIWRRGTWQHIEQGGRVDAADAADAARAGDVAPIEA